MLKPALSVNMTIQSQFHPEGPLSYPVISTWKCSAEKEIEGVDCDSL